MNNQENSNSEDLTKKDRKVLRTKNIILEAAKELFSNKSFEMITMEEIADLAALSRATLYNYFNNKEEIYFSIGVAQLEQWIKQYKLIDTNQNSGEQQVIKLAENLVKDILIFPLYSKLLRRFFNRSKELNLPIMAMFYDSMIEKKKNLNNSKFMPQNKIFLDLLERYIEYRQFWQKAIKSGIKDGSIKSSSNPYHLNFIIIMILLGLLDQIDFRRSLMNLANISNEEIINLIHRLTKKFLAGDI
jgi:AcrR family transcriptional regulator